MKRRLLLLALILGISLPSFTQTEVDVTKLVADTKSFIFDNNKNTVKGYIYDQLKKVTNCCGDDRIYLEVKIDPSGYVLQVKTLTGKNDCFKKSAIDIVKNVRWDASNFKGPKSVYFEIKPNVECESDRENTYAQVEIFNNELLDTEGNRANGATASTSVRRSEQPIAANNTPAKADPTPTKTTTKPKTTPPVASNDKPAVRKADQKPPAQTRSQEPKPVPTNTMASNDNEPPAKTEAQLAEEQRAKDERAAQEEEIRKLKEQMARLRGEEEAARERRAQQERDRLERERAQAEREADMARNNSDDGSGGGLFLDDSGNGSSSNSFDNEPPAGQSEEDRARAKLEELAAKKREIEQAKRQRDNDLRDVQRQNERDNQELLKIEEDIIRTEEQATQKREDKELNRLEEDRRRAELEKQKEDDEYRRMMDEIRRLQDEADRKITELENKKRDIERLAAAKQAREQEIMLERTLRKTDQERLIEERRLALLNNAGPAMTPGNLNVADNSDGSTALGDVAVPQMTTAADSQKYRQLAIQVNLLKVELERLREQLRIMEGGPASVNPNSIASKKTGTRAKSSGNLKNGAVDDSWKNLDYFPEGADKSQYLVADANITRSAPPVTTSPSNTNNADNNSTPVEDKKTADQEIPEYKSGEGYQGAKDHRGSYKNVAGPKFFARNYIDGSSAMKEKISTSLKEAGVCGLGQAAFSLTLDAKGNVLKSQILAASSALVELQLGAILPTLKFNSVDVRYDQTIYLEFKADIACEGQEDKVKLQNVESLIKSNN